MLVRFAEIPPQGMTLEITDQSWFPDHELTRHGAARAAVSLNPEGERVLCGGWLEVAVELVCDRCLASHRRLVTTRFQLVLEVMAPDASPAVGEREHHCRSEEMDTVFLEEEQVNVVELLTQQFYLSLPAKNLCRPDCLGLCPGCGVDLNRWACDCATRPSDSPFAALRVLKRS